MSGRAKIRWVPALVIMAMITFLSHQPDPVSTLASLVKIPHLGKTVTGIPDHLAHFAEYFCLTLTVGYALLHRKGRSVWPMLATLLLVAAFAVSDELHQSLVPRRTPELRDLMADLLGTMAALLVLQLGRLIRSWVTM